MPNKPDIIIADNFYADPDQVRAFALRQEWIQRDALPASFPGTESKRCFFPKELVSRFANLVGGPITVDPVRNSFGAFALTLDVDEPKKTVHVDGRQWTGIIYLTPNEICRGGTNLFKHRATGLVRAPTDREAIDRGYGSRNAFLKEVLISDARSVNAWDLDFSVEMRFNRLFLFKGGERFHAPDGYYGRRQDEGRLVQLFFFDEAGEVA